MSTDRKCSPKLEFLREQAEEFIEQQSEPSSFHDANLLDLIHEVQVSQKELEMQNEELKRAQEELSGLHQEYENLYELAPCGYLTIHPGGIITRANLTAVSLLETNRKTLLMSTLSSYIAQEWKYLFLEARKKSEATDKKERVELLLDTHGSDTPRWVAADISAQKNEHGGVHQFMVVLMDISKRKEAEQEMVQAHKQAQKARQEAETANRHKSEFLARISHEIRTPMNSILGMLRLVLTADITGKQRDRIQVAKSSAESLLWLLNDLLDLSRIEADRFTLHDKEFRLRHLLNNVFKEIEHTAAEKGLKNYLAVGGDVPTILHGDPFRLKQVLFNLLSNSVKFTDQGWVELEASQLDSTPCSDDPDYFVSTVLFRIRDTGKGIDPDKSEAIFHSYDQGGHDSLSAEEGTGLGLAICKKLTEQMGGHIWVDSRPGKGCTFSVQIPFKTDGQIGHDFEVQEGGDCFAQMPAQRILVVEDQKMNRIFVEDLLSSNGHHVTLAENGEQALDMLSKSSFDLVLMDIRMPGMDGIETTMRIRTADPLIMNPDIPVIGLSAHVITEKEMDRFQNAGFNRYVVKPVDFEKLFSAMQEVLGTEQYMHPKAQKPETRNH